MREVVVVPEVTFPCRTDENSSPSNEQLAAELADARLLHRLSIELIQEDGTAGLYKKIVEAAVAIMRSQYASMQMLYPEPGSIGKLHLLASSGFSPDGEKFWEWVYRHTGSSCGAALRTQRRVVIPDFNTSEFMQDAPTLPIFREAGIFAAQSTPLYSRSGKLLGMISTHWDHPHQPPQAHLDLLDILARQAADLIERTQTAEALRESEERLRALTRATNDVSYRMSPDWMQMYQLDGRDFLHHTDESIDNWIEKYIPADSHAEVVSAIQHAIQTKTIFQLEHPDDLNQFAHVASHDLKEPVRKIKTFSLLLKNELSGLPHDGLRTYNDKILESAKRMTTMIDGVLTYSSLNAAEAKVELLDLNQIIATICTDLELLIEQKQAQIHYSTLPEIEGIRVLIYQLFYNLINNSLKFAKTAGEPSIGIHASLESVRDSVYSKIVLTDNGIGFEPQYNSAIFHTFTRLHSKNKYDGTGLGLSLCQKIVERHHGTISANGQKNVGATFTVLLPVRQ